MTGIEKAFTKEGDIRNQEEHLIKGTVGQKNV